MKTMRRISSAMVLLAGILFLLAAPATAINWRITQITDNDGLDSSPKVISQGWAAWLDRNPPAREEIMLYYPGSSPIRQITDNDYTDTNFDLSWDSASGKPTLCWQALCGPDGTSEIYTLGPKAPLRLTDNAYDDKEPKNWGTHIVWEGRHNNADWEIFRYTPSLGVVQFTKDTLDDYNPAVSGSRILWSKEDPDDYGQETYFFDGMDVARLTENAWMESDHRIDGTHMVWGMFHGSGTVGNWEIHHKRGDGPVEQLTDNELADLDPSVSGNRIAWMRYDGYDNEIMYYDGVSVRQLTDNGADDEEPQISGQRVVWVQHPLPLFSYDGRILVFDDADDSITLLEDGFDDGYAPQIAGDFIVWCVWDGHDFEIMMAIACDDLPGDVNKDCVVDLADFATLAADWLDCTLPSAYCP